MPTDTCLKIIVINLQTANSSIKQYMNHVFIYMYFKKQIFFTSRKHSNYKQSHLYYYIMPKLSFSISWIFIQIPENFILESKNMLHIVNCIINTKLGNQNLKIQAHRWKEKSIHCLFNITHVNCYFFPSYRVFNSAFTIANPAYTCAINQLTLLCSKIIVIYISKNVFV